MTTKDYPSLWGFGTTKTFKIPVEHLDFKYIEKCSDVKHLEKILCVLRVGYQKLKMKKIKYTFMKLKHFQWWKIICLQFVVQTAVFMLVRKNILIVDQLKGKSQGIMQNGISLTEKEKTSLATREKEKGNEAFNSGDYEEAVMYYTRSISVLPNVVAYNNRAQAELKLQNWNSAFQDCEKVLELEPGNLKALLRRATTYKHQNKLQEAIEDLNKVLNVEPDNELAKKTLLEVERDLKNSKPAPKTETKGKRMVIQEVENSEDEGGKDSRRKHEDNSGDKKGAEPAGARSAAEPCAMGNIQKKLTGKSEGGKRSERGAPRRGRSPGAGADKRGRPRASAAAAEGGASRHPGGGRGAGDPTAAPPSPPAPLGPAGLKSQGNELFRSGQFPEATLKYSAAIAQLEPAGSGSADDLSILYSNRAACYLKEGNCSGCIQDCTRALELHPFSIKPLLRRAMAYETLEQYQKAYVDYKTVLQMDCTIQLANDSINRITRILMNLDGPSWREKLSPIPAVPTSTHLRAWQPATETPPDQVGDSCSHSQPGITDEKMFKTLKEEGNQCVKDKNYKDALSKYIECLKINNKECAIYTNRALCYLKLCQFEEAKQDCDRALEIDNRNVKACYRRALAHKGLKEYQKSLNDLNKVLLLDSSIIEAKMELEEVTRLLKDNASFNKEKERRKIEIQEVNEGHEEEPERTSEEVSNDCFATRKEDTTNGPPAYCETLPIARPTNAYEFGQVINAISTRNDKEACAHILAVTEPKDLPVLLSNKLEGDTFLLLIQSLKNNLIGKDPSLVYQHLFYLSKAERFKMMLTLISKGQKEQIEQLFDDLSDTPNKHYTLEDVQALRRKYEL
ncbi:sperm-associated antigen 1 isoform X4 [Herpailurus yagouaroundi]|uniref:sperm-associated antigen 1 isoform X4 n=2 Tax=Herpailurus yagouaroundi TaxID=1608482 RepID=UPI001AD62DA0|nr:sperm-associated antigen 1 isoform X4 [Puma yagouaroundi]